MYKPTIGLEVHAELKTKSKMFCGCVNNPHASRPNINTCPVCLAHPGSLPVANYEAVRSVLIFGTAVDGTLANFSEFDRKNYFYPDIPKAYQISQYAFPFISGGELSGVKLTRVHLEEDTARSQHDKGDYSLVDFNRAGVPLMELVTEPVIHDAKTAGDFARELQLTLRTLGISDANMEKGEMRVEANISISDTAELGTKVEVKNLNSFKSVEAAIAFEIDRQTGILQNNGQIQQETRGWDEIHGMTFTQRSKETAKDYRYFPDPDLPKLVTTEIPAFIQSRLKEQLPELPQNKRLKYDVIGLTSNQIETILQSATLDKYFAELFILAAENKKALLLSTNYLLTDLSSYIAESEPTTLLSPKHFYELMLVLEQKKISSRVAKDLIIENALKDTDLIALITERNLFSDFDDKKLTEVVHEVILANPKVVSEYKAGKTSALQFLLGQAMKVTRGAADPNALKAIFEAELLG